MEKKWAAKLFEIMSIKRLRKVQNFSKFLKSKVTSFAFNKTIVKIQKCKKKTHFLVIDL